MASEGILAIPRGFFSSQYAAGDWGKSRREIPMQASEVHEYARQLLKLHGDKAGVVAVQKYVKSERRGDHQEVEDWQRIRDALIEMRGPHVS